MLNRIISLQLIIDFKTSAELEIDTVIDYTPSSAGQGYTERGEPHYAPGDQAEAELISARVNDADVPPLLFELMQTMDWVKIIEGT